MVIGLPLIIISVFILLISISRRLSLMNCRDHDFHPQSSHLIQQGSNMKSMGMHL